MHSDGMHIGAQWRELALCHADRPAIIDDGGTWSYRQMHSRITRFGNALLGLALRKGDRVALLIPDIREYLEADYAIMSAGLVRVPLDPRLTRAEIAPSLRHAGAAALVGHASFADKLDGLKSEVDSLEHVISIGGGAGLDYEALLQRASERPLPDGDGDDLASLNFSGGTTGAPKAVMLRHRNLVSVARNTIRGFEIASDCVFLNVRPLWPVAQVVPMSHLFAGATVALRRFDPDRLAGIIERTGATRTSLVPTQLHRWLDHLRARERALDRLQAVYVGGSRIAPAIFERALDIMGPKIGVLYGLTEAPATCYLPPQSLAATPERRSQLVHCVGRALPQYEVRIAGSEETVPIGSRRSGEVLIRGGNVMAGYWHDEAATAAALRAGWLHTGDIGELDSAGQLSIIGRLKEVIRSGASTIVPQEVEDVMARHPAVSEVAVIGLPDAEWGEAVTAFVVTKPGMAVSERDLVEHCRAWLAGYKKPRSVRFVASLPRSHYGKVLRAQLIAQATL
jgi:acyl-CoA synthetase (AMP-forming)/AMP-acid ligase II